MFGVTHPHQARKIILHESKDIGNPANLEEQAIKLVGTTLYEKLIKGYTQKQWRKDPKDLPASIIKRLPVRYTYDNNYFNDKYQGIPTAGYTHIFEQLLEGVEVRLDTDFFQFNKNIATDIIYTGPIDRFFHYQYGALEYKTTSFKHIHKPYPNHQGVAVMNYTSLDEKFTRVIEHKHFTSINTDSTIITEEYPCEYVAGKTEAFYPVNDIINNNLYMKYKAKADSTPNTFFKGRLAEYKYYDMHQVIESTLAFMNTLKQS